MSDITTTATTPSPTFKASAEQLAVGEAFRKVLRSYWRETSKRKLFALKSNVHATAGMKGAALTAYYSFRFTDPRDTAQMVADFETYVYNAGVWDVEAFPFEVRDDLSTPCIVMSLEAVTPEPSVGDNAPALLAVDGKGFTAIPALVVVD